MLRLARLGLKHVGFKQQQQQQHYRKLSCSTEELLRRANLCTTKEELKRELARLDDDESVGLGSISSSKSSGSIAGRSRGNKTKNTDAAKVLQLCVTSNFAHVAMACKLMDTLAIPAQSSSLELIDKCLDYSNLDAAMEVVGRMKDSHLFLDMQSGERLVSQLSMNCRIEDIESLFTSASNLIGSFLHLTAEPLIMSGRIKLFANHFEKLLQTQPQPTCVDKILRHLMLARTRRFLSQAQPSEEENQQIVRIYAIVDAYHDRLGKEGFVVGVIDSKRQGPVDVSSLCSWYTAMQMYEHEREPSHPPASADLTPQEAFFVSLMPKLDSTGFPFLVEDREPPLSLRINDLSTEIARMQPDTFLLVSKDIFPQAFAYEMRQLRPRYSNEQFANQMISLMSHMGQGEMGASEDQDEQDEEDDDEDEDDDDMDLEIDEEDIDDDEGDDDDEDDEDDDESEMGVSSLHVQSFDVFNKHQHSNFPEMQKLGVGRHVKKEGFVGEEMTSFDASSLMFAEEIFALNAHGDNFLSRLDDDYFCHVDADFGENDFTPPDDGDGGVGVKNIKSGSDIVVDDD